MQKDKNPPILWDYNCTILGESESFFRNKEEYIDHLQDAVVTFYEDSIYRDSEENLYLYIEKDNIWSVYVGTDNAKEVRNYYARIRFLDIMVEEKWYHSDLFPSKELLRRFVDKNFDKNFFDTDTTTINCQTS